MNNMGMRSIKARRRRLRSSKGSGEGCVQEFMGIDTDESPSEKALREKLILQIIFTHLSTSLLLYPCSLVNKTWNAEAGKVIRDHRKCTAKKPCDITACEFLHKLDQLCGQITERGRIKPFNCLEAEFSQDCFEDTTRGKIVLNNLKNELKLKTLEFSITYDGVDCQVHKPLLTLLRHKSSELRRLQIGSLNPFLKLRTSVDELPRFYQLEDLDIAQVCLSFGCFREEEEGYQEQELSKMRSLLQWLLKDAPNLKKIAVGELTALKIFSDEVLKKVTLHGRFKIRLSRSQDFSLLHTASEIGHGLAALCIYEPPANLEEQRTDWIQDDILNTHFRRQFDSAVEKILRTNHQSLKELEIVGAYPLASLSHPPLVNLSKLSIHKRFQGKLVELWNVIAAINFERMMPSLEEVEITMGSGETEALRNNFLNEWPPGSNYELNCCTSVRKLRLKLIVPRINLRMLKAMFPNVTVLSVTLTSRDSGTDAINAAPLPEIWECFPKLVELQYVGYGDCFNKNFDADICGIHEEETEFLRSQDDDIDDYLENVHIVPVKYSVLTMPNLLKLTFQRYIRASIYSNPGVYVDFKSDVTQLLALDRMPQIQVIFRTMVLGKVRRQPTN